MTQFPDPTDPKSPPPEPQPRNTRSRRRWQLAKVLLGMAIAMGAATGYWRLRFFVYTQLVPQIQAALENQISRPVSIGAVEGFSPIGIRFGPSRLPATPTDADTATAEAIRVRFNLLRLLFDRTLRLNITLMEATATLDQDEEGQWLQTRLTPGEPGPIKIELGQIGFDNSVVTLLPAIAQINPNLSLSSGLVPSGSASPDAPSSDAASSGLVSSSMTIRDFKGQIRLRNGNQQIGVNVEGKPVAGGTFQVNGTANLEDYPLFEGTVNTRRLPVSAFVPLAAPYLSLPLPALRGGFLSSQVQVTLANPSDLNTLDPTVQLQGNAELWELSLYPQSEGTPIQLRQAKVRFREQRAELRDVRANYGRVRAEATGQIHLQDGYDITATLPSIILDDALAATGVALPVQTAGEFEGQVNMTGALNAPVFNGLVTNKGQVVVDELAIETAQARLSATPESLEINTIEVIPQVGGSIIGGGQLAFSPQSELDLTLLARDIPGDQVLEATLGPRLGPDNPAEVPWSNWTDPVTQAPLRLGPVSADIAITGGLSRLRTAAQFDAPRATFPLQGEVLVADEAVFFNTVNAQFNRGELVLDGRIDLAQSTWQTLARIEEVPLNQLPLAQLPLDRLPIERIPRNPILEASALTEYSESLGSQTAPGQRSPNGPASGDPANGDGDVNGGDRPESSESNTGSDQEGADTGATAPGDRPSAPEPKHADPYISDPKSALFASGKPDPRASAGAKQNSNDAPSEPQAAPDNGPSPANGDRPPAPASGQPTSEPTPDSVPSPDGPDGEINGENNGSDPTAGPDGDGIDPLPAPALPGLQQTGGVINGRISASGSLDSFRPEDITLIGQLQLSDAPFLNEALSTSFQWTGQFLAIEEFSLPSLQANGRVNVQFSPQWVPSLGRFDLNVQVNPLDLTEWDLPIPDNFAVAGITTFDGRLFGTVNRPNVDGVMTFEGLAINQVAFEPLVGPVRFGADQGVFVDLQGDRDRIAATLDPQFRPLSVDFSYGTTAQTTTRIYGSIVPNSGGDRFQATIEQFPLSALNLSPAERFELGPIGGVLNGNVVLNVAAWDWRSPNPLDTLAMTGRVAIAQPSLGYLAAECFQGAIQLADGVADIREGQLRLRRQEMTAQPLSPRERSFCATDWAADEGQYRFDGRLVATGGMPSFTGQVAIEQGNIQDWLRTLQFFDLGDIAKGLKPANLDQAADVTTVPLPFSTEMTAGPSNTNLFRQLQRYAEIVALREQQRRQQQAEFTLPELRELEGTFSGTLDLASTADTGFTAQFDLAGEDWRWGPYPEADQPANQLIAQGEFADGTLTFSPLRFQSGEAQLNFAGAVGWQDDATGQFQASNISAQWLRQFFKLPLNIDGNVNATAAVTGTLQNPQARGSITLSDASLNQTPIESAGARFSYADARLGVLGNMQLQQPEPLSENPLEDAPGAEPDSGAGSGAGSESDASASTPLISFIGSLPYRLPQATVQPDSDDINLSLDVRDEGIELLNLLNEHFFWEDGEGTVTLEVGGTLRQTDAGLDIRPTITGTAQVESATFSAKVLPAPLTDVVGNVQFDGDRITVNTFRGNFSEGDFSAVGVIPLLTPFTDQELAQFGAPVLPQADSVSGADAEASPPSSSRSRPNRRTPSAPTPLVARSPREQLLALQLNNLAVNFKGLYNGGVDGTIDVRGTALKPELGGEIVLSNGRVSLPDPTIISPQPIAIAEPSNVWTGLIATPELTDLKVVLGRRLLITRLPLLNFLASGELRVNGPLQTDTRSIRPEGIITLHSGQVNVFTTQFNLDRSHNNTAIFTPNTGSDPLLNVRLETSVLEETRRLFPDAPTFNQSEIAETTATDFSQFQTIRIQASVEGQASQLFDRLELSSSPSRSETEIVALIGGGFIDTLGRSEGFIGIANLAGTALFTSLQTLLSNAIGFSDLRIFPTVITDVDQEEEGGGDIRPTSTLALAAELGFRLTNELSVSALQLLTVNEPTQYNLRYQINDELLLRGSTNFSDDSRIILEFETRF